MHGVANSCGHGGPCHNLSPTNTRTAWPAGYRPTPDITKTPMNRIQRLKAARAQEAALAAKRAAKRAAKARSAALLARREARVEMLGRKLEGELEGPRAAGASEEQLAAALEQDAAAALPIEPALAEEAQ